MNAKDKLVKIGACAFMLTFLFSVSAGLIRQGVCGSQAAYDTFTHSILAEFGTATW